MEIEEEKKFIPALSFTQPENEKSVKVSDTLRTFVIVTMIKYLGLDVELYELSFIQKQTLLEWPMTILDLVCNRLFFYRARAFSLIIF